MKWSLNELRQAKDEPIEFAETLDLQSSLKERRPDLISMTPVEVKGIFTVDQRGVIGSFNVKTTLTLPSTRTFDPVELPLNFDFSEYYVSEHQSNLSQFDDLDVVIALENDVLSLNKVVEDNILLQIPMKILSDSEKKAAVNEMPQGKNWGVLTEKQVEEHQAQSDEIDPRLAKLKDYFKSDDESNSDE